MEMDNCRRCDDKMVAVGLKNNPYIGVEIYNCPTCTYRAKICLLCVSQKKDYGTCRIKSSYAGNGNLVEFASHFIHKHIFPAIGIISVGVETCLILYDINSEELGMQTHCDGFFSILINLPQLCYLIPLTPYDIAATKRLYNSGGMIIFNRAVNIVNNGMTNVMRYLRGQSYACLYCGKIYDALPTIEIVAAHIKTEIANIRSLHSLHSLHS